MGFSSLQELYMSGVQWEITDTPLVRANIQTQPSPQPQSAQSGSANRTACIVPPIAPAAPISVETVESMANRPNDINALNRMIAEFNHPLRTSATNPVLIHVAPNPNGLIIVTDIPSADDDATGSILSGAHGEMLDKMINAIGMSRDNVSIMPMLFWRTPGGRTPTGDEIALARPFVNRALELIKPRAILTLGSIPASEIANINLGRAHGVPVTQENGTIIMPIYHPNYLMLKPTAKRDVWNALQNLQILLKSA